MVHHDVAQSLIARCLVEPYFLTALASGDQWTIAPRPQVEHAAQTDLIGQEQLSRLMKLRAFVVKVKHNTIRRRLPLTFALIDALGLELEFFGHMADDYLASRAQGPLSPHDHLALIERSLSTFIMEHPHRAAHALGAILRHELTLQDLQHSSDTEQQHDIAAQDPSPWRGHVVLQSYDYDVLALAQLIGGGKELADHAFGKDPKRLIYWQAPDTEDVRLIEIDPFGYLVLRLVDNGYTFDDVQGRLGALGLTSVRDEIKTVAAAAKARGMVSARTAEAFTDATSSETA